jgi:hypothetical protein
MWDGNKYILTFVNDCTHFIVYVMKNKSDVYENPKWHEAMMTAQFGKQVAKLLCDNGEEYVIDEMRKFVMTK